MTGKMEIRCAAAPFPLMGGELATPLPVTVQDASYRTGSLLPYRKPVTVQDFLKWTLFFK